MLNLVRDALHVVGFVSKDQPEQDNLSIDWDDAFDLTKLDFSDLDPFADTP